MWIFYAIYNSQRLSTGPSFGTTVIFYLVPLSWWLLSLKNLFRTSQRRKRFHVIAKFHLQHHGTNLNHFQTLFPGALATLFSLTDELEFVPCSTGEVSLLSSFSLASLRVASSSCLARSFSSSCLDRSCWLDDSNDVFFFIWVKILPAKWGYWIVDMYTFLKWMGKNILHSFAYTIYCWFFALYYFIKSSTMG